MAKREVQQGQVSLMRKWLQEGRNSQRSLQKAGNRVGLVQDREEDTQEEPKESGQETAQGEKTGIGDIWTDKECMEDNNLE